MSSGQQFWSVANTLFLISTSDMQHAKNSAVVSRVGALVLAPSAHLHHPTCGRFRRHLTLRLTFSSTMSILILDGGLGTALEQKYNVAFSPSTPLWSSHLLVADPQTLLRCQRDFGCVPVDIILTATYQASIHGFAATGIPAAQIPEYLDTAVDTAAAAGNGSVALSIGPYGACMLPSTEYSGAYDASHDSEDALYAWHKARMDLFCEIDDVAARVRYLSLETIPRTDEIRAMRRALADTPLRHMPFWMSCLYPEDVLPSGETADMALRAMFAGALQPWGVGINCTKVWKLDSLLRQYESTLSALVREGTVKEWPALVLYPDGTNGEVYNTETQVWELPDGMEGNKVPWETQLADAVRATQRRGHWKQIIVGGCCMASADDIKRLRNVLLGS